MQEPIELEATERKPNLYFALTMTEAFSRNIDKVGIRYTTFFNLQSHLQCPVLLRTS